jgi:hypothetical protein
MLLSMLPKLSPNQRLKNVRFAHWDVPPAADRPLAKRWATRKLRNNGMKFTLNSYKEILISGVIVIFLTACSGGSGSDSGSDWNGLTDDQIEGRYYLILSYDDDSSSETGTAILGPNGEFIFSSRYYSTIGLISSKSSSEVIVEATTYKHAVSYLNNELPGASNPRSRTFTFSTPEGVTSLYYGSFTDGTRSGTLQISKLESTNVPDTISLSRNWEGFGYFRFVNPVDHFIDYSSQIAIDTAGVVSGYDTFGCSYSGSITKESDDVSSYSVELVVSLCTQPNDFGIVNGTYSGRGWYKENALYGNLLRVTVSNTDNALNYWWYDNLP